MLGRVYVVEDDPNLRLLLARMLEDAGFQVRTFFCAEEASAALGDQAPDVLVADVGLPLASGVDLHQFVRDMAPRTRVLLISGHQVEELAERGVQRGAPFLRKPFTGTMLRRSVLALAGLGQEKDIPRFGDVPGAWAVP